MSCRRETDQHTDICHRAALSELEVKTGDRKEQISKVDTLQHEWNTCQVSVEKAEADLQENSRQVRATKKELQTLEVRITTAKLTDRLNPCIDSAIQDNFQEGGYRANPPAAA